MAIDLVTFNDDQMINVTFNSSSDVSQTCSNNRTTNLLTNEFIELIKCTTLNNNPNDQISSNGCKNRRFSLTDIHSFDLRRVLLHSLTSSSNGNTNNSMIENKLNIRKSKLDSIKEKSNSNSSSDNRSENEIDIPNDQQRSNCDVTTHHNISTSSSAETIKVEDRFESDNATKTEKVKDESNLIDHNEDILETLRQVLRMCTKTDASKRASATEIHEILETKLMKSIIWLPEKQPQVGQILKKEDLDKEEIKEKDSKD